MFVCKDWLLLYKRAIEFAWLPSKYQYWITTEWRKNSIEFNLVSFAQHVGVKNYMSDEKIQWLKLTLAKNWKGLVFCIYLFQRIKRHRKLVVILANSSIFNGSIFNWISLQPKKGNWKRLQRTQRKRKSKYSQIFLFQADHTLVPLFLILYNVYVVQAMQSLNWGQCFVF